jgi:glycosyltransferase involved in cell wall biosynthesis
MILELSKPKISVLMANYNNGEYITEAIESVINQTFKDWELIIIDDCSTDNSVEIIEKYLGDKRIRFFKNKKNVGKIEVLRTLVKESGAEIVGILDSDDALTDDALAEIYKAYKDHPECGFIYSQFVFCDKKLKPIKKGLCRFMPDNRSNIQELYTVAFRTYKKSDYYKINGYDDDILYAEDRDLILKMEEVTKLCFVDKVLYKYRRIDDSQTTESKKFEISRSSCALAEYKAYSRRRDKNIPNLSKSEVSYRLLSVFPLCIKVKDYKRAKFFLFTALKLCPFNVRGYAKFLLKVIKYPFKIFYYKLFGDIDALTRKRRIKL